MLTAMTVLISACGGDGAGADPSTCGANGSCPSGYTCETRTRLCILSGMSGDAPVADSPPVSAPDASPDAPPDAPGPDAPGCNLLVNGGFELPVVSRDAYSTDPAFLPGWTLSAGGNQFFLENGMPFAVSRHVEGAQSVCLNGDGVPVFIEQTFATVAGKAYNLTFYLTDEQVAGPSPAAVLVDIADFQTTFDRTKDRGFVKKTLHFVAPTSTTTLRITDKTPASAPINNPIIDDVVIGCE